MLSLLSSPSILLYIVLPIIIIYISHYYKNKSNTNQIDQLNIINNKIIELENNNISLNDQIIELKNKNNNRIVELENNNNSLKNRINQLESINNNSNNNNSNNDNNRIVELEINNNSLNNKIIELNNQIIELKRRTHQLESINKNNQNNNNALINNNNRIIYKFGGIGGSNSIGSSSISSIGSSIGSSSIGSSSIGSIGSIGSLNMYYINDSETMSRLFSKVFGNMTIRNEILKYRDLYKEFATSNQKLFNNPYRKYFQELEYTGTELLKAGAVSSNVKKLTIDRAEIEIGSIPYGVNEIHFGKGFNSPLKPNMIPTSTKSIIFHNISKFNQPITRGSFNEGLCKIKFSFAFNHQLQPGTLPSTLEHLTLSSNYNHPIEPGTLPPSLKYLYLGSDYNHPIEPGTLPSKLKTLYLGNDFNHPIEPGTLPSSLEDITFGCKFNHPIKPGTFNKGLYSIKFGASFNQSIPVGLIPSTVEYLHFNNQNLNQIPSYDAIPHVRSIYIHSTVKERIKDYRLNQKIKYQFTF